MRSNIVLIDFENVRPDSLQLLASEHFRVLLFVGANQTKLPFETVEAIQKLGVKAEYIKIAGNGPNALDFHIAYYIGTLAATEPAAYFHIVSRDTGFDPLIQYLKNKKVLAARVEAIGEIPLVKVATAKSPAERIQIYADKLAKATKPGTLKSLKSDIASYFRKQLSDAEVAAIVDGLIRRGFISVAGDTTVTYAAASDAPQRVNLALPHRSTNSSDCSTSLSPTPYSV